MNTLEQCLNNLLSQGEISEEEAISKATVVKALDVG